jgi:hypothetical protein
MTGSTGSSYAKNAPIVFHANHGSILPPGTTRSIAGLGWLLKTTPLNADHLRMRLYFPAYSNTMLMLIIFPLFHLVDFELVSFLIIDNTRFTYSGFDASKAFIFIFDFS